MSFNFFSGAEWLEVCAAGRECWAEVPELEALGLVTRNLIYYTVKGADVLRPVQVQFSNQN